MLYFSIRNQPKIVMGPMLALERILAWTTLRTQPPWQHNAEWLPEIATLLP